MFGILENMPGSEKLFGIKEMFYTKQLNSWLLYFKKMSEIPYLHRKDQKLIRKLIEKLEAISVDFPADNLSAKENKEEIEKIEAEFVEKHGFIAEEPPEVPRKFDFSDIFTEKSGKWAHPKLHETYHFRTDNEEKMFEIIEKVETETRETIEKMTESSEMEEDSELEDMWNRRIRNKILQVKYFSIYPH